MLDDDWTCSVCSFRLYYPVSAPALTVTRLGLYAEGRFPGRALLVFCDHVEHLEALAPADLSAFWTDAAAVGDALRRVTGAARVNYAVLGNSTPHLHVHLIPRHPGLEPLPTRPPWSDPRPLVELDRGEALVLQRQLSSQLS